MNWYTVAEPDEAQRLVAAWPGAPVENTELAGMLLDVAREQVLAFAPLMANNDVLPPRYVYAQLAQAKTLWSAGMADENGSIGTEGYSFTPRPLDKTIRGIIRPTSGTADVL